MRQSYLSPRVQNKEVFFYRQRWEWLADVNSTSWFSTGCVSEEAVCFTASCHAITCFCMSHQAWNPTRPERSQAYLQKPDALSSTSPCCTWLVDSETSRCSKHGNKHAPPKVQLPCCLHNRCGLDFLAVCLTFWLLSRSFEKENSALFEWQGTTVVLLPHPHLDWG